MDHALVRNGWVVAVARSGVDPECLTPDQHDNVVAFPPNTAFAGMLWNGESLTSPPEA